MNYTLREGFDDRSEKVERYILRFLPIVVASVIAVFGAFVRTDNRPPDSASQEPLAIYTAPESGLGQPSNPQSTNDSNGEGTGENNQTASSDPQANRSNPQQSFSSGSAAVGGRGGGGSTTTSSLGGSGGGSGGSDDTCLCESLPKLPPPPIDPVPLNQPVSSTLEGAL
jgi:hypothetical protein